MTEDNSKDKVVLFIDVLGFAALTESCELDLESISWRHRIFSVDHLRSLMEKPKNRLAEVFSSFHFQMTETLRMAEKRHALTAITFSDSAFIATTQAHEAVYIAANLMKGLVGSRVPARIGMAYGSFAALRFASEITPDSGNHAAQFLGTAVVRAHAAETCGIKGCRILLHPSLLLHARDEKPSNANLEPCLMDFMECPKEEQSNKAGVTHEVNYWNFRKTEEDGAWKAFQELWAEAPVPEARHYVATAEAVNRMRIARGFPPLTRLEQRRLRR